MKGKVVVISGATSGIGKVAAETLATMGARIVFTARDQARGETTLIRLRDLAPGLDHRLHLADLTRLAEMKRVAKEIATAEPQIDVLLNNAGAMFSEAQITEDGLERTFALNHISYFVLAHGLRHRLQETPGARIVNTSSNAHRNARLDYEDPQSLKSYRMFKAYCRSKLYNILFTRELSRRMKAGGITVNSLHPGFVASRFGDETTGISGIVFRMLKRLAITPAQGAETLIHLASSEKVSGISGEYFYKCVPTEPTKEAQDDAASKWLWAESERLAQLSN